MFSDRDLSPAVARVREAHAPGALVYDVERDFETLDPAVAEELGVRAETLEPLSYDPAWIPDDTLEALGRLASGTFTIGAPGDGGVAWTRQTVPPTVFVKPRLRGSPAPFVEFLLAEALVEVGLDVPETFLGFFRERYPALAAATPLSPAETYQLGVALYDAWVGLHTRETFADGWAGPEGGEPTHPTLYGAWLDAGERLEPRLAGLAGEVARGETGFAAAAELACSAVKHDVALPTPFGALDTAAYRQHGPEYAVRWAEKTFEKLGE